MKKLGFGMMRLPQKDPNDMKSIDIETVEKMVDLFMESGFTYFDTAYPYHMGASEPALAQALVKRYPRDSFTIADKLPTFMPLAGDKYEPIFNEQLARLQTDYFDYYLLHNPHGEFYDRAEKNHAFEFIAKKKAEGKIRNIGVSLHDTPEFIDKVLTEHPELDFVQIQLNYLDWENKGIRAKDCYEAIKSHGKPVIVMEPVKGGTLCNLPDEATSILKTTNPEASLASWAIRFAASLDDVMVVLSGMSTLDQVRDNTSYMSDFAPMSAAEHEAIDKVVGMINASIAIPCTGCGYCLENCPKKIPIPTYFALYNAEKQDNKHAWKSQGDYYSSLASRTCKASDCKKCGKCEKVCPQHLKIRDLLADVADEFENRRFG